MAEDNAIFEITDFRLAGYLLAHGCPFAGVADNARGEVVFKFRAGPDGKEPSTVLMAYPGSPEYRYDSACRTMHDFTKLKRVR